MLLSLEGVQVPVASALLTIARPETFTVFDVLAMRTLRAHDEWGPTRPPYAEYLNTGRGIADRCGTNLRTLDQALWAWGRANKREPAVPPMCPDQTTEDGAG